MDDILIIGGGIIGSSIAYYLARDGRAGRITVIERDNSYAEAATPRSLGGLRQQFSLAENVLMSQYGLGVYRDFGQHLAVGGKAAAVDFREQGYLFLADETGMAVLEANHRRQCDLGAVVELLAPGDLAVRFPWLALDGLAGAAFGFEDGWLDPHGALQGFRRAARTLGVGYLEDEVIAMDTGAGRVAAVRLKSGERRPAGQVINAAGAWSGAVAAMAGMELPIVPSRRQVFFFETRRPLGTTPLVIDASGVYFRPEGKGYLAGKSNPDEPEGFNFAVDHGYFNDAIWPVLAARGGILARPGAQGARLRGAQGKLVLGLPLRSQHPRSKPHHRSLDRRMREFPSGLRLFRPWPAAGPGGGPRHGRAAARRLFHDHRPGAHELSAGDR